MAQITERFDFKNTQGHTLSGRLELPKGRVKAYALFAHCFTCSKNILATSRISKSLSEKGIAVLRFDFTGLGNSEGDFENSGFSSNTMDLISAYKAIEEKFKAPEILIGHSLGGSAVLKACQTLPEVKAVVTIGAPSDVAHIIHLFKDGSLEEIETKGRANIILGGREFSITKSFVEDLKEATLLEGLSHEKKSFLIMHSPTDDYVSIDHAAHIYGALKHPKSFISLDEMDHLLSKATDAEYISNIINAWSARYLSSDDVGVADRPFVNENEIEVTSRDGYQYTHDIFSHKHEIVADEPKPLKGDDLGMNPMELLLSSLGACTAMTTKMYAARKGIDLQNVLVHLKHSEGVIFKKIELKGDFNEDQRKRMFEIADKCPVNKILTNGIQTKSTE